MMTCTSSILVSWFVLTCLLKPKRRVLEKGHSPDLSLSVTEQSSQWDGFRHFSQPADVDEPGSDPITTSSQSTTTRVFYGGTTLTEIRNKSSGRIGTQHWAEEGIAGEISFALAWANQWICVGFVVYEKVAFLFSYRLTDLHQPKQ